MRFFFAVLMTVAIASCNNDADKQETVETPKGDSLVVQNASDTELILPVKDTSHVSKMNWQDSLIVDFINHEGNDMVKATRKEGRRIEWMNNGTERTDSATYFMYQLGHSFEGRFVTDAWLYIDSARHRLYERDLVEDRLIKWKAK